MREVIRPNRKPTRNANIMLFINNHPKMSYAKVANVFRISRQRLYEIRKAMEAESLKHVEDR